MRYALALILLCSVAAFAQQAAKTTTEVQPISQPERVKPPADWLQKYAVYLTKNAEMQAVQVEVQRLGGELLAEMNKDGYVLDAAKVEWVRKPPVKAAPAPPLPADQMPPVMPQGQK